MFKPTTITDEIAYVSTGNYQVCPIDPLAMGFSDESIKPIQSAKESTTKCRIIWPARISNNVIETKG